MTVLTLRDPGFLNVSSTVLWTPANITTALWLDAADVSTVNTVSGAVSQWNDKSGNSRHAIQDTPALRPSLVASALNGNSAIRFDGIDDRINVVSTFLQGSNSYTITWIFTRRGSGSGADGYRPSIATYSTSADLGVYHFVKNANNLGASYPKNTAWNNYDLSVGTPYVNGSFDIMQFRASVTRWDVFRNGLSEGGFNNNSALSTSFASGGLSLGGQFNINRSANIDICEVVVTVGTFSSANNEKLEGYLAHKWGLTANLPSDHPYKLIPPTVNLSYDSDALAYITAVETADGQSLESEVKDAINKFVVGCKADGIWTAIKASCILAGARTLNGALVPLVGTAPTNFNFVAGDYNRKTGLVGNGSNKYLNSNRKNHDDPSANAHCSVWISTARTNASIYMGAENLYRNTLYANGTSLVVSSRHSNIFDTTQPLSSTGLFGWSRASSTSFNSWANGISKSFVAGIDVDSSMNYFVFARNSNNSLNQPTNARLAFYSIGESLDLAKLDSRVTTLINAFGTAIA
jgi:hypothetical protein